MWIELALTAIVTGLAVWGWLEWRSIGPLNARCAGFVTQNTDLASALCRERGEAALARVRLNEVSCALNREMVAGNALRARLAADHGNKTKAGKR